jgi:HK97 family phage portal protein
MDPAKHGREAFQVLFEHGLESILPLGYRRLSDVPEIVAAAKKIACLVSMMTIKLMHDEKDGAHRVKNALSRVIDINPNPCMTRSMFIQWNVMNMLLHGRGNSVCLIRRNGDYLEKLVPVPSRLVGFEPDHEGGYIILVGGKKIDPDNALHFVYNPHPDEWWRGQGVTVALKVLADNLRQNESTRNAFLKSNWKPSVIIAVDSYSADLATPEGREEILDDYVRGTKKGEPWVIPANQIDVKQVTPLSLKDLAIPETASLDRRTVAAIFGVPAWLLGEGSYTQLEWNNFINTEIASFAKSMGQEMTRKLIFSDEYFVEFSAKSLYDYSLTEQINNMALLHDRAAANGDELRHVLGLDPAGLTEFHALENYIPYNQLGNQKKLKGEPNDNG